MSTKSKGKVKVKDLKPKKDARGGFGRAATGGGIAASGGGSAASGGGSSASGGGASADSTRLGS
jgi:hypothetical protein